MLGRLSGRTHQVHTAVALVCTHGVELRLSSSAVRFRRLTDAEIDWYWRDAASRRQGRRLRHPGPRGDVHQRIWPAAIPA